MNPIPNAIFGFVGAVLGQSKDDFIRTLGGSMVAAALYNVVKNANWLTTK
jgi:hypothetical protein